MAHSPLNKRLADQQRHHENRARLAHAYSRFTTEGVGTVEFEDCIDFGLTFVERPFIAVGHQIDMEHVRDLFDAGSDEDVYLPQVTGYVIDWDMTDRDHYVGCWVAVSVSVPIETVDGSYPMVKIHHDFTWSGIALKDIPSIP